MALNLTQQMYLEAARNGNAEAACALLPWLMLVVAIEDADKFMCKLSESLVVVDKPEVCRLIVRAVEAAMKEVDDGK